MTYINSPFNYTGNKFKLLPQIAPILTSSDTDTFFDVFGGGGVVWGNMLPHFDKVIFNDIITDLQYLHSLLIQKPSETIEKVKELCVAKDDQPGYVELRTSYNEEKSKQQRAMKLYALMLCCTNNMLRFNKKGGFNQTFGKRTFNPNTEKKLKEWTEHIIPLKDKLKCQSSSYNNIKKPLEKTLFYMDPPYMHTEAGYNAYWSEKLENDLYKFCIDLNKESHNFAISGVIEYDGNINKNLSKLEKDFNCKYLEMDYNKVSRSKNNKNIKEVIITNF